MFAFMANTAVSRVKRLARFALTRLAMATGAIALKHRLPIHLSDGKTMGPVRIKHDRF